MTKKDFALLENELALSLPEAYRALVRKNPFRKLTPLPLLLTQAEHVLQANRRVRERADWQPNWLVIGSDGAGNDYFVDLASSDLSVYLLDHEVDGPPLDVRLGPLADYVDHHIHSLGLGDDEDSPTGRQAASLLRQVERLWLDTPTRAERAYPEIRDRVLRLERRLVLDEGADLGTRLAMMGEALRNLAAAAGVAIPADRPPFHGCHELREIGYWLARGRSDLVIQRLAVCGKRLEDANHHGAAAALYSEAQRLGASAQSAIDRLSALGHPVDPAYTRFLENLRSLPNWPAV